MRMFLDLDGVFVNLYKAIDTSTVEFPEGILRKNKFDILFKECPRLFKDLEPMPDAQELLGFVRSMCCELIVLTALPIHVEMEYAIEDKKAWAAKHLGPDIEFRVGPHAVDKQYHCENTDDILIDDNLKNIGQWQKAGGVGIYHVNAASSIKMVKAYLGHFG